MELKDYINKYLRENLMSSNEDLLSHLSDLYKDVYGSRPNLSHYMNKSEKELISILNSLQQQSIEQQEEERRYSLEALKQYETAIEKTIDMGAGDRLSAIRWLFQASDDLMDAGHFMYVYHLTDLPQEEYHRIKTEVEQAIKEL